MPELPPNDDTYKKSSAYLPYVKAQPKSVDRLPWWLQNNVLGTPQQGMQIFAPGVNAAIKRRLSRSRKGCRRKTWLTCQHALRRRTRWLRKTRWHQRVGKSA